MNWYKIAQTDIIAPSSQHLTRFARYDSIYNIYKMTNDAPDQIVKDAQGHPIQINADSPMQALMFAKQKYPKLYDWENEFGGRTLMARINKEKQEDAVKYREIMEELKRKKEDRAQSIYDN